MIYPYVGYTYRSSWSISIEWVSLDLVLSSVVFFEGVKSRQGVVENIGCTKLFLGYQKWGVKNKKNKTSNDSITREDQKHMLSSKNFEKKIVKKLKCKVKSRQTSIIKRNSKQGWDSSIVCTCIRRDKSMTIKQAMIPERICSWLTHCGKKCQIIEVTRRKMSFSGICLELWGKSLNLSFPSSFYLILKKNKSDHSSLWK